MKRGGYRVLQDKERFELEAKGEMIHLACCDCGLVHDFAIALEDNGSIGVAIRRNKSRTQKLRKQIRNARLR